MTLCQDVILTIGSLYVLSFDLYTTVRCSNMFGRVFLNDELLTMVFIGGDTKFRTHVSNFSADRTHNTLCFN